MNETDVNPSSEFWLEVPGDPVLELRHVNELCSEYPHNELIDLIHAGNPIPKGKAKDGLPIYTAATYRGEGDKQCFRIKSVEIVINTCYEKINPPEFAARSGSNDKNFFRKASTS